MSILWRENEPSLHFDIGCAFIKNMQLTPQFSLAHCFTPSSAYTWLLQTSVMIQVKQLYVWIAVWLFYTKYFVHAPSPNFQLEGRGRGSTRTPCRITTLSQSPELVCLPFGLMLRKVLQSECLLCSNLLSLNSIIFLVRCISVIMYGWKV